jgi:starch-binding outer membrane protein, SusD/RagB family
MLDERAREMYWEGTRRSDLVRFGKFTGSTYNWAFKGGTAEGTSLDATRALYPIPSQDLAANPSLKQNPGY